MLTIVGNIFQSLTERLTLHRIGQDLHLANCIASPSVVAFIPSTYYTTKFSVILKNAPWVTPSTMVNPVTQIFISGHLSPSPPHHLICIEVPCGNWFIHHGNLDNKVEHEVRRAVAYGKVYVAKVCWDSRNIWDSYVKVVDCSVGQVSGVMGASSTSLPK